MQVTTRQLADARLGRRDLGLFPTVAYAKAKADEILPTISLLVDVARIGTRPIAAGKRYSLIIRTERCRESKFPRKAAS
jgi:hypothetical protein